MDNLHDVRLVGAVHHHQKHLLPLFGVAALGIEERGTTPHLTGYCLTNLLVLLREDHDLVALLVAVEHHVEHVGHHTHHHIAVNHIAQLAGDEIGASHDDDVNKHDDTTGRYIMVLADYQCNDVGTAGVASHDETQADAQTAESATNDGTHEGVKLHGAVGIHEEILHMKALLPHNEEDRAHGNAVDGVGTELGAQHFEADGHEYTIKDKV